MARSNDRVGEYHKGFTDQIIAQIKEGTAPWQKPWKPGERALPENLTTGRPYAGGNSLYLSMAAQARGYTDNRWATFRQIKLAGGYVRRGEKGTQILFFDTQKIVPAKDDQGKPKLNEAGDPLYTILQRPKPFIRVYTVFNAEQTEGLPKRPPVTPVPDWKVHADADAIIEASAVTMKHQAGDRAYYDLRNDQIVLPEPGQFAAAGSYYRTALHELAHSTGHPDRMNRDSLLEAVEGAGARWGGPAYAKEELRAEISSMMTAQKISLAHESKHGAAYVASWIKALENDPREIYRAAADAEKISRYLMEPAREHVKEQNADTRGHMDAHITRLERPPTPDQLNRNVLEAADVALHTLNQDGPTLRPSAELIQELQNVHLAAAQNLHTPETADFRGVVAQLQTYATQAIDDPDHRKAVFAAADNFRHPDRLDPHAQQLEGQADLAPHDRPDTLRNLVEAGLRLQGVPDATRETFLRNLDATYTGRPLPTDHDPKTFNRSVDQVARRTLTLFQTTPHSETPPGRALTQHLQDLRLAASQNALTDGDHPRGVAFLLESHATDHVPAGADRNSLLAAAKSLRTFADAAEQAPPPYAQTFAYAASQLKALDGPRDATLLADLETLARASSTGWRPDTTALNAVADRIQAVTRESPPSLSRNFLQDAAARLRPANDDRGPSPGEALSDRLADQWNRNPDLPARREAMLEAITNHERLAKQGNYIAGDRLSLAISTRLSSADLPEDTVARHRATVQLREEAATTAALAIARREEQPPIYKRIQDIPDRPVTDEQIQARLHQRPAKRDAATPELNQRIQAAAAAALTAVQNSPERHYGDRRVLLSTLHDIDNQAATGDFDNRSKFSATAQRLHDYAARHDPGPRREALNAAAQELRQLPTPERALNHRIVDASQDALHYFGANQEPHDDIGDFRDELVQDLTRVNTTALNNGYRPGDSLNSTPEDLDTFARHDQVQSPDLSHAADRLRAAQHALDRAHPPAPERGETRYRVEVRDGNSWNPVAPNYTTRQAADREAERWNAEGHQTRIDTYAVDAQARTAREDLARPSEAPLDRTAPSSPNTLRFHSSITLRDRVDAHLQRGREASLADRALAAARDRTRSSGPSR